jgi:type I restriction enzyme M protein
MSKPSNVNGNNRRFSTQASLDSYVWGICNTLRRSNCAGALQYVPELTWILFLRILDDREGQEAEQADAVGAKFVPSLKSPYRWQDWADPQGRKRVELQNGALGAFFGFVNGELLPYLKGLRDKPNATPRQKVISEILSGVERVRVDTEKNFLDVLDRVHEIRHENIDTSHIFALSQTLKVSC